jgi:tRNA uridine 5-carboxymethylaminomethyl modification enzyme
VFDLLGRSEIDLATLADAFPWLRTVAPRAADLLRTEARYAGYLPRQRADIRSFRKEEAVELAEVSFAEVGGLSGELLGKLMATRPVSLGAASRIEGMTPAALAALAAYVRKRRDDASRPTT